MSDTPTTPQIGGLFRKTPVMTMADIERAAVPRSRRSLFRDLISLDYLSSYTHTGRYYTLKSIAEFDIDGLWRYQGVGFSRDGTLKATVQRLVETSEAGRTQRELGLRLGVRVHNPLLDLVNAHKLARETVGTEYVYVAVKRVRASEQLQRRQALAAVGATAQPAPTLEIEVLLEVIHGAKAALLDAATIAARLGMRGIGASVAEVGVVLSRHQLVKKTAPSRSKRSRH